MLYMLLLIYFSILLHPVHVAVTGVDIAADRTVTVTHKFFTDDFTLLFYHLYEKNIIPSDSAEFTAAETEIITGYLNEAFILASGDGQVAEFEYTGKDQDGESVWIYMKGRLPQGTYNSLEITNNLMFDLYMDQTNLVIVYEGGTEQGFSFYYNQRTSTLALEENKN